MDPIRIPVPPVPLFVEKSDPQSISGLRCIRFNSSNKSKLKKSRDRPQSRPSRPGPLTSSPHTMASGKLRLAQIQPEQTPLFYDQMIQPGGMSLDTRALTQKWVFHSQPTHAKTMLETFDKNAMILPDHTKIQQSYKQNHSGDDDENSDGKLPSPLKD
ncbi:uncharacterized protein LOC118438463 [Folsomia candida]|nr:uncharacterized protein LOC118438463 [Folsomia candida]